MVAKRTSVFGWMVSQIQGAKSFDRRSHIVNAELSRREILAWIKAQRRPITRFDLADRFKLSDQLARRRLDELSSFLVVDRSCNRKGLPARYTPKETK